MALDLVDIVETLTTELTGRIGRTVNVTSVVPDRPPVLGAGPWLIIVPADEFVSNYAAMSKGLAEVFLELRVYVVGNEQGQRHLLELMSAGTGQTSSVVDALEAIKTGGSTYPWSDLVVSGSFRWDGRVDLGNGDSQVPAYAAVVPIAVRVPRT